MSSITWIADENTFISVFAGFRCACSTGNSKKGKSIRDFYLLYMIGNVYFCNRYKMKMDDGRREKYCCGRLVAAFTG